MTTEIALATLPGTPGRRNEDFAAATPDAFVVLDGVTPGPDDGCRHGVPWYVAQLGPRLLTALTTAPHRSPADCLAESISAVADLHRDSCDLSVQTTPQATVAAGRLTADRVEYLVLADCTLLLDLGGELLAVTDDRVEHVAADLRRAARALPEGTPERAAAAARYAAAVAALRNRPGGFWTAAAEPAVAAEALTGSVERSAVVALAAMSDGAARFSDVLGLGDHAALMKVLAQHGPAELLDQIRAAEQADPERRRHPRGKVSDDATVIHFRRQTGAGGGI